MSEIEDRRQRALEAYWDVLGTRSAEVAAQEAIEAATRVKITDDVLISSVEIANQVLGAAGSVDGAFTDLSEVRPVIAAALAALGFEVEQ